MKVKEIKGWNSLNKDFDKWYSSNGHPEWKKQQQWLSKELLKRSFVKEKDLLNMWSVFHVLTHGCSSWKVQSKILSFIILCLNEEIGEELELLIK